MADKPSKPTPDFPLSARNNGQWAKKIKGEFYYFGPWADPLGALQRYHDWLSGKPTDRIVAADGRPRKPHPGFPLYAHSRGQWAKKIKGKIRYFGRWADPIGALDRYHEWLRGQAIEPTPSLCFTIIVSAATEPPPPPSEG